ncbi:MAG TPA: hypothetical protein VIA06_02890 [Candidatus Dormibacteraeota bacterium]|jgi:hypothetical protein|nr:hypothetical protein [Candidatus Dormibacteraeota bacterium]
MEAVDDGRGDGEDDAPEVGGPPWRIRDSRLIWLGQTLSDMGTGVTTQAYPLLAPGP